MSQKENNMQAEDTKALEEKDGWKRGGGWYIICVQHFSEKPISSFFNCKEIYSLQ